MSKLVGYARPLRAHRVGTVIVNHLSSADGDQTFRGDFMKTTIAKMHIDATIAKMH
jgi:hypothetical protein